MAVWTGRGERARVERKGGRTDRAPDDPERSAPKHDNSDIPQFAPNFSAYLLPPDAVCLYSEDRKFFLRGELYCALATAIGAGKSFGTGKSFGDIVSELERKFPAETIQEAFRRLIDRRFVVMGAPASGVTAAYWASLGLAQDVADDNLRNCRLRIQSLDVEGAAELGAALTELGVRVVKRDGDLTVTLVGDYLEGRLAELNRQHLSDATPWLLAQPSGLFPLIGPVFTPGEGPCWTCLSERMKRNREVKALLDRTHARCVAVSPLVHQTFGQTAIQLASVEIAKAIATGLGTDLSSHVVSLDLLGSTVVKHYVAKRPQCPACGREDLRDPARAAVPIELHPGSKLVMTSGGYRSVSPAATVARYRKHVSPLTGVVSRLERIQADLPMNTNFQAVHNFSPRPETVDELKAGLSGGSYGKGSTAEQGEASALMEAIERYSGIYQGDEIRITRRFTDFPPGDAVLPNDVMLFSDAQLRRDAAADPHEGPGAPDPFDRTAEVEWSPVWSLRDGRFKYLPTSLLYFFYKGPGAWQAAADSNGCAAGNTLEEAIIQGFLELVERNSYATWWYNRVQRAQVDLDHLDDTYIRDLQLLLAETGRRVWMLDITNDLEVPSFVAVSHSVEGGHEQMEFGSGSHFDARIAALRAMTELNQFLSIGLMTGANEDHAGHDGHPPLNLREHPYLVPRDTAPVRPDFGSKFGHLDRREQVLACVRIAERQGLDFLVLDQTRPDIEVPVARVIVPGMRHFYRRFAPGRLYDVPVKLGLLDRPRDETDLNPHHPPT